MDKKLMIYPFNKRVGVIARYSRLLKDYVLTAAVSPRNYGYEGKDVSYMDAGDFVGVTITSSFQEGLAQCDSILFSASTFLMDISYYEEKMREAADCGKEILITRELAEDFFNAQRSIPTDVKVLGGNPPGEKISYNETKHVREISVPVMTIFQIGEFCQGFDTLLLMAERFENEGYKVSKISSSTLSELFGIQMLPEYIYDSYISYEDKIVSFNHFLTSIAEDEDADVLLLEIEEAILPYNDRITNHFGIIPSIITKAVQADVSILNLYYSIYDKGYLDHLKSFCRYALNAEINYINIGNTTMIIKEFDSTDPIYYVSVSRDTVLRAINSDYNNYDCMFFNTYDSNSVDSAYHDIVDKLSQNKETVRI